MPGLDMSIAHELGKEEANQRIKKILIQLKEERGDMIEDLREEWGDQSCRFSFTVMGYAVSGLLESADREIRISAHLPFVAAMFRGKIEAAIREKAEELLS